MKRIVDFFHNLFIPHENNNFRARALHIDFLTYYLIFALFITFGFKKIGSVSNVLGFATDISVDKLYQLTNQKRTEAGLQTLSYSDQLAAAAAQKAQDMFAKNYWAHYGPGGTTPWNFILAAGYRYQFAGENLAKNFLFSSGVVDAWMNSPTHRENMVRPDYTDVGFAVVNGTLNGEQTTLVVQMFGKPQGGAPIAQKNTVIPSAAVPTLIPTIPVVQTVKPTVAVTAAIAAPFGIPAPAVLAREATKPRINLLPLTFNINIVFLSFLLLALALDFYFAVRMKVIRVGGKNIAHFIFIMFILSAVVLFASKGAII